MDHDYPFYGTKHLDPIGINEEPVKLSIRTKPDFAKPNRLNNPFGPEPKSLTNYEAYNSKVPRSRTNGLFMNDPQRLQVVKHPGDLQVKDFRDILKINPEIKAYLKRQMDLEDKKQVTQRKQRVILEEETKKKIQQLEKIIYRRFKLANLETWQSPPSKRDF